MHLCASPPLSTRSSPTRMVSAPARSWSTTAAFPDGA